LFYGEASLTGVNSVFTLPADFGRVILFRDENGNKVFPMQSQEERRLVSSSGRQRIYYRMGNTLVLDKTGVSKTYTLIYIKKPRDVHHGMASAGGALSITLATAAPKIVDYFNGMTIENKTKDWVDTISDYSTARVATLAAQTAAASDYYGIVPELPEWSHHLISPRASYKVAKESPVGQRKPDTMDYKDWLEMVRTTLVEFAAPSGDFDWEEMFTSFEPNVPQTLGIIGE